MAPLKRGHFCSITVVDREAVLAWGPGCAVRNVAQRYFGGSSGESSPASATKAFSLNGSRSFSKCKTRSRSVPIASPRSGFRRIEIADRRPRHQRPGCDADRAFWRKGPHPRLAEQIWAFLSRGCDLTSLGRSSGMAPHRLRLVGTRRGNRRDRRQGSRFGRRRARSS